MNNLNAFELLTCICLLYVLDDQVTPKNSQISAEMCNLNASKCKAVRVELLKTAIFQAV